ncbi:hypothetical protein PGB28_06620 [Primorskyibacter aestuariivivens]|uniref:hypothetical protein n=1 Tax=Primorskyibacter aestuariivivens TaxID=1888912 RepID=UPI0022FFF39F|nr:hypothetical protein [Primorskyibacter aestuariivivens]MDA7428124.1 hypothetical protein [Primorskyibacter aestuariivivens]
MAMAALIGGSFLGTLGGVFGWLLFGLSGSQAFLLYLGLGLFLPLIVMTLAAILSGRDATRTSQISENHAHTA